MSIFNLSDAPTFACVFAVSETNTDPTTVSLFVRKPNGTTNTYTYAGATITKDSTGHFSKQITLDQRGVWYWEWTGTGACQAGASGTITVRS